MLWEILKASKGILVADFYADLWANIAGGGTPVDVFVEMIGSLPLYCNGKGYDLTDYLISGNTVQDGTPSPDAPVDATGCGVRTGNLFDISSTHGFVSTITDWTQSIDERSITVDCTGIQGTARGLRLPLGELKAGTYNLHIVWNSKPTVINIRQYPDNVIATITDSDTAFSLAEDTEIEIYVVCQKSIYTFEDVMLNLGSTAFPYEPYGFKLPLTVNGVEYPIYLGTVPTTRRVKKLVLTGEESWSSVSSGLYRITVKGYLRLINIQVGMSSHFGGGYTGGAAPTAKRNELAFLVSNSGNNYMYLSPSQYLTTEDFKSYLAAQYAAGTPVTIWYVLAEPETGIVNEPLMKIGDYADTVSFAQAGVTIPTVNGANVLDMTSPVKPSEMYIKGKGIKPTGYGHLKDVNGVNILDKYSNPIYVHGQ